MVIDRFRIGNVSYGAERTLDREAMSNDEGHPVTLFHLKGLWRRATETHRQAKKTNRIHTIYLATMKAIQVTV